MALIKGSFVRRRFFAAIPLVVSLALVVAAIGGCQEKPDPYAGMRPEERLAREMLQALGGMERYDAVSVIRFDVIETLDGVEISRRHHDYDKKNGLYAIKWAPPNDEALTVTFNDKRGIDSASATWSSGIALHQDSDPVRYNEVTQQAYEYYLHDLYMVFAPYKLLVDNPEMTYYGLEKGPRGRMRQKLHIRHNKRGAADNREYTLYVDPQSKLITSWIAHTPEGPEVYLWQKWQWRGPLRIAFRQEQTNGGRVYEIAKLAIDVSFYSSDK